MPSAGGSSSSVPSTGGASPSVPSTGGPSPSVPSTGGQDSKGPSAGGEGKIPSPDGQGKKPFTPGKPGKEIVGPGGTQWPKKLGPGGTQWPKGPGKWAPGMWNRYPWGRNCNGCSYGYNFPYTYYSVGCASCFYPVPQLVSYYGIYNYACGASGIDILGSCAVCCWRSCRWCQRQCRRYPGVNKTRNIT